MPNKFCHLLLSFLVTVHCNAQQNFTPVDKWLHENLHEIGGRGVIMAWKDGKVIYSHAENDLNIREKMGVRWAAKKKGKDENEELQDFTPSTPKPLASCSKWLSAAVIMTFVQEGRLGLEDSIGKYLPIMTSNGKGNIKIKHCLSHLTGIKAPPIKEAIAEQQTYNSTEEEIGHIATLPMEGEPGKSFHYSNVGLQIVGAILEKISGQTFEALFQQRVARPCGMKHTSFGNKPVASLGGGAVGNAEDYLQFLSMILNDGDYHGHQILTNESIVAMQQNYAKSATVAYSPEEAGNWGYGFGEWVMDDGGDRAISLASPGLFGTFPWVNKQRKYAAILFCSNINFKGRHERYVSLKGILDGLVTE